MHPDKIEELSLKAIENFAKLEVKVASIETSITMLRVENEKILSKISESLERLAQINEKMSSNSTEHKTIHKRIDECVAVSEDMAERLHKIELEHEVCMAKQKQEQTDEANSIWIILKNSAVPIVVTAALSFALWIAASHLPEYMENKQVQGAKK